METGSNPTASPATHSGAWYDRLFADVVFSEVADRILYAFAPNEAFAADIEERFAPASLNAILLTPDKLYAINWHVLPAELRHE